MNESSWKRNLSICLDASRNIVEKILFVRSAVLNGEQRVLLSKMENGSGSQFAVL